MRNSTSTLGSAGAASLAAVCLAAAQGQAAQGDLVQELEAAYPPTIMDASGIQVTHAGATLAVKREGIQANPARMGYCGNDYENGQVTANTAGRVRGRVDSVTLDDKAYLRKLEVKRASIDLYIQTCGSCDPSAVDPAHPPYLAKVSVHFANGFLSAADFSQVQQAIGEILAAPDTGSGPDDQADIRLGQTPDQVVAVLGTPQKTVSLGLRQIYVYKNLKVTFVQEKVTNAE
jgi:hypothetical protein